jgi:hypothetical protein
MVGRAGQSRNTFLRTAEPRPKQEAGCVEVEKDGIWVRVGSLRAQDSGRVRMGDKQTGAFSLVLRGHSILTCLEDGHRSLCTDALETAGSEVRW